MTEIVVDLLETVHVQDQKGFRRAGDGQRLVDQLPGMSLVVESGQGVAFGLLPEGFLVAVFGVGAAEQQDGAPGPFLLEMDGEVRVEPLLAIVRVRQPIFDEDLMGFVGVFVVRLLHEAHQRLEEFHVVRVQVRAAQQELGVRPVCQMVGVKHHHRRVAENAVELDIPTGHADPFRAQCFPIHFQIRCPIHSASLSFGADTVILKK